jgi:cyclin H
VENEVYSAAAYFFRKFFVSNSVMDHVPSRILVICFNLACKTEEFRSVALRDLSCNLPQLEISPEYCLEIELKVLICVGYNLQVEQPWPLILFVANQIHNKGLIEDCKAFFNSACDIVSRLQWTGAVTNFRFTEIAIYSCILAGNENGVQETVESAMQHVLDKSAIKVLHNRIEDFTNTRIAVEHQDVEEFLKSEVEYENREKKRAKFIS